MIGISALFIRTGRVGGAEYMLYNLVYGLSQHPDLDGLAIFTRSAASLDPSFRRRLDDLAMSSPVRLVELNKGVSRFVLESTALVAAARTQRLAGLLYANYYTPPRRLPLRTATVIHDLQYRHLPQNSSVRKRLWLNMAHRATLRYTDTVIVPSRFVRDDILNSYGARFESKVHVIPNPISWDRFGVDDGAVVRDECRQPYILSVASHYDHKNLETLIRAFAVASQQLPDHRLVLTGQLRHNLQGIRNRPTRDLRVLIDELALGDRVIVKGHVSDAILGSLYRHADLFVLPSIFEGFGLPPVEALGLGIPTLTTRCASLPEVTLGKASYVDDPFDSDELAGRIVDIVHNRRAFVPAASDVESIRRHYSHTRVAADYLTVLQPASAPRAAHAGVPTPIHVRGSQVSPDGGRTPLADTVLTICIPTYRRAGLVERAIRSAITASLPASDRVELIVSDNSPELTEECCQAALSAWPGRAVYLGNRPNIGMIPNFNQCIARARGRYVMFVHDDDYLLPAAADAVLAAAQSATERDAALLFGVQVVDADGHLRRHQCFRRDAYLSPPSALICLLSDPSFVRVPAMVIRRDVFDTIGLFDATVGGSDDFDMWLRISSRFGIRCVPATISAYSVHEVADTTGMFTAETIRTLAGIFDRAGRMGILPERVVRRCEVDWFYQFVLAGANRRLSVSDRRGAEEIMALFNMPEIRALGLSRRWLIIRLCMELLVSAPLNLSRAVAQRLQYRGSWSAVVGRTGRLALASRRTL